MATWNLNANIGGGQPLLYQEPDLQARQAFALKLLSNAAENTPVRSKWQGVNRLAQGLTGGLLARWNADEVARRQQDYSDTLAKALGGDLGTITPTKDSIGTVQQDMKGVGDVVPGLPSGTPNTVPPASMEIPAPNLGGSLPTAPQGGAPQVPATGDPTGPSPMELMGRRLLSNPQTASLGFNMIMQDRARRQELSDQLSMGRVRQLSQEEAAARGLPGHSTWQVDVYGNLTQKGKETAGIDYPYSPDVQRQKLERPSVPGVDRPFSDDVEAQRTRMALMESKQFGSPTEIIVEGPDGKRKQVLAQQNSVTGAWHSADEKRTKLDGVVAVSGKEAPGPGDPGVEIAAKAIAGYQQAPITGFALRSPYGQAVMQRVQEIDPDYQAAQFGQRSKAYRDFGTGPQGNTARSLNVAIEHMATLDELGKALNNKDAIAANKIINTLREQTGDPRVTNFDSAREIVGTEVAKAVVGSSSGQSALADREAIKEIYKRSRSPAQLLGVTQTHRSLLAGQLTGLRQQYNRTTGRKDFDDEFLSDRTRAALGVGQPDVGGKGWSIEKVE